MGSLQECLLSPLIFKAYTEYIVKISLEERAEGAKIIEIVINNIKFAKDTMVLAKSE